MTDETPKQPQSLSQSETKEKTYEPPTLHAVDMRKDRYGLKYPNVMGTARPDKEGYGQLMRMQATTTSGFHNIMTPEQLKKSRANYRSDRKAYEQDRGRE